MRVGTTDKGVECFLPGKGMGLRFTTDDVFSDAAMLLLLLPESSISIAKGISFSLLDSRTRGVTIPLFLHYLCHVYGYKHTG